MIDTKELTPWTAPGLATSAESQVINKITETLNLPDTKWVTLKSRKREIVVARQILHTCLTRYFGYSQSGAGMVTMQDHVTVLRSCRVVTETLMHVKSLRPNIDLIFSFCENVKNFDTIESTESL